MGNIYTFNFTLLIVVIIDIILCLIPIESSPTLSTIHGDVRGVEKEVFGKKVEVFYGIPFAEPPVGERRFRAPEPVKAWKLQVINGTVKPLACVHPTSGAPPMMEMGEDCLYLNVWRRATRAGDKLKTIMVWIHGGSFTLGSAVLDVYDGINLAARKDVIVVTIAYRLGALGFMYLSNSTEVSGNAGLFDQAMALKWVKDNALNLGGDPNRITIFGESAGAVSVGFHLLSPISRDLFNKAAMQSASPVVPWGVRDIKETVRRVAILATNLSCPVSPYDQLLSCLRAVDAQVLSDRETLVEEGWFDISFAPVVDGVFFPAHPQDMLKSGDIKLTKVIIGSNLNEGTYFLYLGFPKHFRSNTKGRIERGSFRKIISSIANNNVKLEKKLLKTYSREHSDAKNRQLRIIDSAGGDALFICPVLNFARDYSALGGEVYLYSFEARLSSNPMPQWMGVNHGAEIEVVFGHPLGKQSSNTQEEKALSEEIMERWTSFAKTGEPTCQGVEWPRYQVTGKYKRWSVKFLLKGTQVFKDVKKGACRAWTTHTKKRMFQN